MKNEFSTEELRAIVLLCEYMEKETRRDPFYAKPQSDEEKRILISLLQGISNKAREGIKEQE